MIRISVSILLLALVAFCQEPKPQQQPACPEPTAGTEVTITISWSGVTVPIKMPAEANSILNKFAAKMCQKYSKDMTGVLTGTKDAPVPQSLWSINLIVETYVDLVRRIVESNPSEYAPAQVKAAIAAAEAKVAEAKAAQESAAKSALQVTQ